MRPGFSEDGVEVALPKGDYRLSLEPGTTGNLVGFSLILAGRTPDAHVSKGTFTLDMARAGVFDRAAFLKVFAGDAEALFDWSEEGSDEQQEKWGGFLKHGDSGLEALYVDVGSDCECIVQVLRSQSRIVGVRVVPQTPPKPAACELGSRHWTVVELKCIGIGPEWSFCDDRDYEPEFDDLLDSVIFEVSCVIEGNSTTCLSTKNIDPDTPISKYQKRFKGVAKISVFYEQSEERRQRLSIPSPDSAPQFGSEATPRQIAETVFKLFQKSRRWRC